MIRDHSTYNTRVFTPFIVPPNRIEFFENEKESPTVCHSCIINRQRYVKFFVSTDRYYYYSLAETTNAANYTTTRAANRTSTTRLLLTIIYYFFPPPVLKRVTNNRVTFIIDPALSRKEKGMQRFNVSVEADLSVRGN